MTTPVEAGAGRVFKQIIARRLIEDALQLLGYGSARQSQRQQGGVETYSSDEEFWHSASAGKQHEGKLIRLEGFNLTEWVPASPGLFHTGTAAFCRQFAERFLVDEGGGREYLPMGKVSMIQGGIGCFRLPAITSGSGSLIHVLGATSTGICPAGVPVALPQDLYAELIEPIRRTGGISIDAVGVIRILPEVFLSFDPQAPKHFVLLQDLKSFTHSDPDQLHASATIGFSVADVYEESEAPSEDQLGWSFGTFNPGPGRRPLSDVVIWLKEYALRYSGLSRPTLVNSFDAHYDHFREPVDFPLRDIAEHGLSPRIVQNVSNYYDSRVIIGDSFERISNAVIINRSLVDESAVSD
jgi:hypothetical protein